MDYSSFDKSQLLKEIEALKKENDLLKRSVSLNQKDNIISNDEKKLLRVLVEAIPAAAVYVDDDNVFFNKAAEEITGYKANDITTIPECFKLLFNNDKIILDKYIRSREEGFPAPITFPVITKEKNVKQIEFSGYKYAECEVWMMSTVISESKLEKELLKKNALLKSILESPKGIIIFSLDKNYSYTAFTVTHKEVIKKIWGADISAGFCMLDVIKNEADREKAKRNFDRALNGEYFIETEEYGLDSLSRTVWENRYSPMFNEKNEIIGLTVFVTDISESVKAKRALTESEKIVSTIFDAAPVLVWMSGTDEGANYFNKQWLDFRGRKLDDELGFGWLEGIHPGDRELCKKTFTENFKQKKSFTLEYRLKKADGSYCHILDNGVPHYLHTGEFAGFIGACIDISHLKKIEDDLRKSEERNKALLTALPDLMFVLSREGYIIDYKAEHEEDLLRPPSEFLGKNIADILPVEIAVKVKEMVDKASQTSEMQTFDYEMNIRGAKYYEARLVPCGFDKFIAIIRDVTEQRNSEKELYKSAQIQKLIFEGSKDITSVQDLDGRYTFYVGGELIGREVEEIIGKMPGDIYTAVDTAQLMTDFNTVLATGERLTRELSVEKDGNSLCFLMSKFPLKNEKNEITGIATTAKNITQLKEVENILRKFSRAVEQSTTAIVITDIEGKIEYVNNKTCELTGYLPEELIGQMSNVFMSSSFELPEDEFGKLWRVVRSGNEYRGELHYKKKSGEWYWAITSISAIKDDNGVVTNYLSVYEDITLRKEMEELLRTALDKAEESNRLKSNLLNNMSHELRTPMNGILGFASILKEEVNNPLHKELLDKLIRSSKRLMSTLNSILDFSMIESNGFELKPRKQNINKAVELNVPAYTEAAKEKNLSVVYHPRNADAVSCIDERFLAQILDNLVDNAVKFTQKGTIDIVIDTVSKNGAKWNVIKVRDTGIGIPEENCKVIFQEFRQVSEGTSRNFEGSGLGLTLAKKITEMMNGEISVESAPGSGSEFTLWFPAEEKEISETSPQICVAGEGKNAAVKNKVKSNILLVEDQLLNIQVTQLYLKSFCKLDYALTVEEALKMVQSKVYDAILMDIHLGIGMSGTQAAREIRKLPAYTDVPIIACTGYAMLGDREKFIKAGFDEYIAKPFEKDALIQTFTSLGVGME